MHQGEADRVAPDALMGRDVVLGRLGGVQMLRSRWLFVGLYTLSGAAALVYEVAWTRLLTLQMGHTVSAVSTVLAAFMGGLAIGAWIAGWLRLSGSWRLRTYAILEILIALIAIVLPLMLRATQPAMEWAYHDGDGALRFALVRAALSAFLLAVPAAAMGATFPIAASWFAALPATLKPNTIARSSAAVVRSNPPGTLRLDEFVSDSAPANLTNLTTPAGADAPKPLTVVVPVKVTLACGTEPRSTVAALAIDARPPPITPA